MTRTPLLPLPLLPFVVLAGLAIAGTSGCKAPEEDAGPATTVRSGRKVEPYKINARAGLPVTVRTDPNALKGLVARTTRFGNRSNPFQLLKDEVRFDRDQNVERLFGQDGSFNLEYKEPELPPIQSSTVEEAQPYRRLSGIVIGDAIVAILETQGQETVLIRPGQFIPNTEWKVVSINNDRAILRRSGNRKPNEIEVKLELPPPGFGDTGAGTAGAPGGRGGGPGGPGGPPGEPAGAAGGTG